MNRFRSRKRSQGEGGDASGSTSRNASRSTSRRPSQDSDIPALPSFSARAFRWRKHTAPEPKPELDISSVLPSSDDFRTSLLMPNLSARFSMLREQDDPNSKIGKAIDDSVLFPKRASRLDLFNRGGLTNITEGDPIHGSIRPPFATARTESYGSGGYDTDEGSVMSRSRPGEGNTMFGGRQKIYKIPMGASGSVKNFGTAEEGDINPGGNMGGKALYESDISMSAFQKLREQERKEQEPDQTLRSSKEQDRSGSPPTTRYNRNRETSSSTTSGPSQPRTSTAATSVASQKSIYVAHDTINGSNTQPGSASSDRPFPKSRRLYGQGLDQHIHEQQSSALHRLESLQRQRAVAGSPLPRDLQPSKSASSLNEHYQRGGPLYASNGFRAGSPPPSNTPSRMADFDLGLTEDSTNSHHVDSGYGRSPPLSPPMSPSNDLSSQDATFVAALEPNDIGKATASGAFNKPNKQYSEQQYLQRQLALHEGRGTPSPQLIRPFSPNAPSIDDQTSGRSRNDSFGSSFSRIGSVRQPWEHHMEDRVLHAVPELENSTSVKEGDNHNVKAMDQSFLNGLSASDTGSESEVEASSLTPSRSPFQAFSGPNPHAKASELEQTSSFDFNSNHLSLPDEDLASDSHSHHSERTIIPRQESNRTDNMQADSPTLGPVGVQNGLSGLVRQHLRNDSEQSQTSVYPEDSPNMNRYPAEVRDSIFGHASALSHSRQQSYDQNERKGSSWGNERFGSVPGDNAAPPPLSFAAKNILEQATALRNAQGNPMAQRPFGNDKAQRVLGDEAPHSSHSRDNSTTWQEQLKAHHTREASTETQKEREDLANELAQRRRMVQNNLKTYIEVDSREASPARQARTQDNSPARSGHPFGILKKTSKGSLATRQERPPKAMKMLGIGPDSEQDTAHPPANLFMGREQLSDRAMPPKKQFPPQPKLPQDARQHSDESSIHRSSELRKQQGQEGSAQWHSPRVSNSGSLPEKSVRNDMGVESASSNVGGPNGIKSIAPVQDFVPAPRPTDELMASMARHGGAPTTGRSTSAMSGRLRSRSNSKTATPGYFEQRMAPPNTPYMIKPSSRSPGHTLPHSSSSTPSLPDHRTSSSSQNSATPTMMPPQSPHSQTYHRPGGRKRSVNKHDISEPRFIFCTSSVDTINLPEGASLSNGMDSPPREGNAPPIPVRDSRRKRTQTLLQALGRAEKPGPTSAQSSPIHPSNNERDPYEEHSSFSADDEPNVKSMRQKLREIGSEAGGSKPSKQQNYTPTSPNVPGRDIQGPGVEHFHYQAQRDVPASAVMF